jgi:SAM-dependent methyltransferase
MLKRLLAHPLTRGRDIDDPATTVLRRTIVHGKPFLKRIYEEWYQAIADCLPDIPGRVLELGSGAGFLADYVPGLITSEIFHCAHVRLVLDGQLLPIANKSLRGIAMINVLHHVPDTRAFLMEAARCLRPGGVIAMIEPWVSPWSNLIYTRLHHEPFETHVSDWRHSSNGPLSGANGALPYIVFKRDQDIFESAFPDLQVSTIQPFMPFRYLVSGGVSMRTLMPGLTFPIWTLLERWMKPQMDRWAMFALLAIIKRTKRI